MADALTDENYYSSTSFWSELDYTKSVTDDFSASFRAYFDYWGSKGDWEIFPEGFPGYPDGMIGRPATKNRTIGSEFQFDLDMSENNHLITGLIAEFS